MNVLHVDSSICGDASVSRALSKAIVARIRSQLPRAEIIYRDLAADPLSHLSGTLMAGRMDGGADLADVALKRTLSQNAAAMTAFLSADIVVLGAPMYNFGIPSQLKAWIDHLAVAGKTFRYTAAGPEGLAGAKRVVIASTRGGVYGPTAPTSAYDFQEPYLRAILNFFGITQIDVVRAEGVALGPQEKQLAIDAAHRQIEALHFAELSHAFG